MSRIGKKPIEIPEGVEVQIQGQMIAVKGPRGTLSREFRREVSFEKAGSTVTVVPTDNSLKTRALWGVSRTVLANMIQGVMQGYEKRLQLEGVGYRAAVEGDYLTMNLGFTHPVKMKTPEHTSVSVEKNVITVGGIDKETVGQFAAKIKAARPVEPYKGKGIRYENEVVRRKLGKKAVSAGG